MNDRLAPIEGDEKISTHTSAESSPSEASVADYLAAHPDFLLRHPDLLATLEIAHQSGSAISLVERQLSLLRKKNSELERRLEELLGSARHNEVLTSRLHRLAIALVTHPQRDAAISALRQLLEHEMEIEFVRLRLIGRAQSADPSLEYVDPQQPALSAFDSLFRNLRPVCGRLTRAQLEFLFSDVIDQVASAAMVAIGQSDQPLGMLALASSDPARFTPDMDTFFLQRLGELVTSAVALGE